MALYVGTVLTIDDSQNLLVKTMENVQWGGMKDVSGSLSGSVPEHYIGLSELTSGYTLSGYKSSACCNDVNKAKYATDTNIHISNAMCQGNYNCGGSAPLKGGMSWASCGCQGSSANTRFLTYATETITTGPNKTSRQNNGTFDYEVLWMSHNFGGGSTTHETYNWKTDAFSTAPASPHTIGCDISWQTHDFGYSYGGTSGATNSTLYNYNFSSSAWATCPSSGGQSSASGTVCPAWSCLRMGGQGGSFTDSGKGYTYNHGIPNIMCVMVFVLFSFNLY